MKSVGGIPISRHGPALLIGLGHGGTHWVAAFFYLLLPYLTDDLGLSYAQAGSLVALFHAASALANLGSGALVDVTGRRVGYQIGSLVMGGENRAPNADEIDQMKGFTAEALEQGACGFSTGLIYRPGRYSTTEEIITAFDSDLLPI